MHTLQTHTYCLPPNLKIYCFHSYFEKPKAKLFIAIEAIVLQNFMIYDTCTKAEEVVAKASSHPCFAAYKAGVWPR